MDKNMKTKTAILGILSLFLSGCSNTRIKHVDAEAFLKHAELMKGMNSVLSATYIGSTHNRVYLEHGNYITFIRKAPITTIYWTEIDSLPKEVSEKIKTRQTPWIPFDHKKYEEQKLKNNQTDQVKDLFAEPNEGERGVKN